MNTTTTFAEQLTDRLNAALEENEAMRAELAELRKDKERLDWVEATARAFFADGVLHPDASTGAFYATVGGSLLFNPRDADFKHNTIRAAIDATIEETKANI